MNAGDYADDVAEFVIREIDGQPDETSRQIVFSRVLRALREHRLHPPERPTPKPPAPMSHETASAFETRVIPFGAHAGETVGEVDVNYLIRLTDPSDFVSDVKRYLRSDRGKKRIEEGE
jgi:hypothetical protein